jgi:hypothetical protein
MRKKPRKETIRGVLIVPSTGKELYIGEGCPWEDFTQVACGVAFDYGMTAERHQRLLEWIAHLETQLCDDEIFDGGEKDDFNFYD